MKLFGKTWTTFNKSKEKKEVEVDKIFIEKKAFDVYYHYRAECKITITAETKEEAKKIFKGEEGSFKNYKVPNGTGYVIDDMQPTTILEEKE